MKKKSYNNDEIKSLESGEWTSVKDLKAYKNRLREAAGKTMLKD